ncbi:MAG: hypothetical protein AMJ54_10925 [Deltaproteobacteria bacterium SG8_13]|nr:MAG: hypothetical protein AMJ54_10925 [Deltaproteobacteria bacterium SG8_13]
MEHSQKKIEPKKWSLIAVAVGAGLLAVFLFIYWLLESKSASPVALLVLAALISVALPMLRVNLFPSARECAAEYDFHDKRLDEQVRRQIADACGPDALEQMDASAGRQSDSAVRLLRKMLEGARARKDEQLRFALLVALSQVCEQSGDTRTSIEQLKKALESRPHHFIANFRLALQYERIGKAGAALVHYQQALRDSGGISRGMKRLASAQIKRLQASGP